MSAQGYWCKKFLGSFCQWDLPIPLQQVEFGDVLGSPNPISAIFHPWKGIRSRLRDLVDLSLVYTKWVWPTWLTYQGAWSTICSVLVQSDLSQPHSPTRLGWEQLTKGWHSRVYGSDGLPHQHHHHDKPASSYLGYPWTHLGTVLKQKKLHLLLIWLSGEISGRSQPTFLNWPSMSPQHQGEEMGQHHHLLHGPMKQHTQEFLKYPY